MTYKGKKVNRHRHRQLTASQQNRRKMFDNSHYTFYPNVIKELEQWK